MYGKGKKPRLAGEHKGYHGSPHETHKVHGGEVAGTKELGVGSMPGKAAMRVKPALAGLPFEGGAGGKLPKTGKPYTQE